MEDLWAKDFKIFLFQLPYLPTGILNDIVVHCSDQYDLENALMKYRSSTKFIACNSSELIGLDLQLRNSSIDTLYVINNEEDSSINEWLYGIIFDKVIQVTNQNQLMRYLSTTAVSSYYKQSIEYKNKGNNSMANSCILASLQALDYAKKFM